MDGIIKKQNKSNKEQKSLDKDTQAPPAKKDYQRNDPSGEEHFISIVKRERSEKEGGLLKRILKTTTLVILITVLVMGSYILYKVGSTSSKISSNNSSSALTTIARIAKKDRFPLKGEDEGRINILLLGKGGKGIPGGNLTDTIIIASIDTRNNKTALFSLPRDFYVQIHGSTYNTKINSIYGYGLKNGSDLEPLIKTIEDITELKINYHVVADFEGFKKFIDSIDGIVINNERDIYDPKYPGPNYSYELFALKKGTHLLDGDTALKYARERHDDPQGDFGRAKRQQQVLQSVRSRIFSTKVLLNPFAINNLLDILGESISTDMSLEEIDSFLRLSKEIDTQNVTNVVVDAWNEDSLLKVSHVSYGNIQAFILIPRIGMNNYGEIQDLAQNIFELERIEKREEEIKKEKASIAIINQSGNANLINKVEDVLEDDLGFENVVTVKGPNLKVTSTQIFDLTNGENPFTLDELMKKLPATLVSDDILSSSGLSNYLQQVDIVAILGSDLANSYSYSESSLEELEKNRETSDNKSILIPVTTN